MEELFDSSNKPSPMFLSSIPGDSLVTSSMNISETPRSRSQIFRCCCVTLCPPPVYTPSHSPGPSQSGPFGPAGLPVTGNGVHPYGRLSMTGNGQVCLFLDYRPLFSFFYHYCRGRARAGYRTIRTCIWERVNPHLNATWLQFSTFFFHEILTHFSRKIFDTSQKLYFLFSPAQLKYI